MSHERSFTSLQTVHAHTHTLTHPHTPTPAHARTYTGSKPRGINPPSL